MERNRRLAEALEIDSSSDPFNVRTNSVYSDSLKEDARFDTDSSFYKHLTLLSFIVQINLELMRTSGLLHKIVNLLHFSSRKDLKFVTDVEEEMKNLVELANKVMQFIGNAFFYIFVVSCAGIRQLFSDVTLLSNKY